MWAHRKVPGRGYIGCNAYVHVRKISYEIGRDTMGFDSVILLLLDCSHTSNYWLCLQGLEDLLSTPVSDLAV